MTDQTEKPKLGTRPPLGLRSFPDFSDSGGADDWPAEPAT